MRRVWNVHPNAKLTICGHAMPADWLRRWVDHRLSFTGYIQNLVDMHAASSIFVAPLQSGGGSKLKVLEAMAAALPVVGTAESVSGLAVRENVHFIGAESDEQFVAGIVAALADPGAATRIGAEARKYVTKNHDWIVAADALEKVWFATANHR